jgi:hypothetical protein
MQNSRTRRSILGGIGATLATSVAVDAQKRSKQQSPPQIQLDLSINLDRDDVYTFLSSTAADHTFDPVLTSTEASAFQILARKDAGTQLFPDPKAKKGEAFSSGLLTAKKLRYFVRKRRVVVGELTAIDVYSHPVQITIQSVLLVTNAVAQNTTLADKMRQVFLAYDPAVNPDPFKYATQNMGNGIDSTMFMVRAGFLIHKNGPEVAIQKQSDSVKAFYSGKLRVTLYNGQEIVPYLEGEQIDLTGPEEEILDRVPKPEVNAHRKEIPQGATSAQEDQAANDIISQIGQAANGNCELKQKELTRIAAIFGWPEFRIDWVDVKIQVGCIWVIFSLPIPRVRFSDLVLFAYVLHQDIAPALLNIVLGCLSRSAIAGAVIGVVADNLQAALAVFEAFFQECIVYQIICATPGLALVVESTSWT